MKNRLFTAQFLFIIPIALHAMDSKEPKHLRDGWDNSAHMKANSSGKHWSAVTPREEQMANMERPENRDATQEKVETAIALKEKERSLSDQ